MNVVHRLLVGVIGPASVQIILSQESRADLAVCERWVIEGSLKEESLTLDLF
jgi:hypothetical protein